MDTLVIKLVETLALLVVWLVYFQILRAWPYDSVIVVQAPASTLSPPSAVSALTSVPLTLIVTAPHVTNIDCYDMGLRNYVLNLRLLSILNIMLYFLRLYFSYVGVVDVSKRYEACVQASGELHLGRKDLLINERVSGTLRSCILSFQIPHIVSTIMLTHLFISCVKEAGQSWHIAQSKLCLPSYFFLAIAVCYFFISIGQLLEPMIRKTLAKGLSYHQQPTQQNNILPCCLCVGAIHYIIVLLCTVCNGVGFICLVVLSG